VGDVVIWSGEDDPKDTLIPRLIASGADCGRVHIINGILSGKDKRMFDPALDIEPLYRTLVKSGKVRLLIIDPIVSAIQGDSHKNAEVRRGLQPIAELAGSLNCVLLGVTHFSKNTGGCEPVERITGSLAFGALARIVLVVSKKTGEDGKTEHILCRAKSNNGPDSGGFKYEMLQSPLKDHPAIVASYIKWGEAIEGTAREILTETQESSKEDHSALKEAKDFLIEALSDDEERYASELIKWAHSLRISERTLKRAKAELGILTRKFGNAWTWQLPPKPEDQTDSTVPTIAEQNTLASLASLAPLDGPTLDEGFNSTVPIGPTVPGNTVDSLVAPLDGTPSGSPNWLTSMVPQGIKELRH